MNQTIYQWKMFRKGEECLETMETLIQRIIADYPRFIREEAQFERHLDQRENSEMRYALTRLKTKISTVNSWFTLLDVDERYIFKKTLVKDLHESAAERAATLIWTKHMVKDGLTPWQIQERAVEKIIRFAEKHSDTIKTIFIETRTQYKQYRGMKGG